MEDKCTRCGAPGHGDLRTLYMKCLYDMNELKIPLVEKDLHGAHFFTMKVCKACRASWMKAIKSWFVNAPLPITEKEIKRGTIFIRELGAVVELEEGSKPYDPS